MGTNATKKCENRITNKKTRCFAQFTQSCSLRWENLSIKIDTLQYSSWAWSDVIYKALDTQVTVMLCWTEHTWDLTWEYDINWPVCTVRGHACQCYCLNVLSRNKFITKCLKIWQCKLTPLASVRSTTYEDPNIWSKYFLKYLALSYWVMLETKFRILIVELFLWYT
jgi:hypothetical protein